jgi:magnesium chelatase subunit H
VKKKSMTDQVRQTLTDEERDRRVRELYERVLEVEQRLIPTGLHVFGQTSNERECADLLRMVASFDRPDAGVRALPTLIAEGLSIRIDDPSQSSDVRRTETEREETLRAREHVDVIVREGIAHLLSEGSDAACLWL